MIISDECGSGPYEALVLVEDSRLVDVPAILFAHLEEPPRVGAIITYNGVTVRLEERREATPAAGVAWCWIGRTRPQ